MNVEFNRKCVWISSGLKPVAKGFFLTLLLVLQASASEITNGSLQRVAQSLEVHPETKLFVNALKTSDLWKYIEEVEAVTMFVPKDEALHNEGSAFLLDVVLLKDVNHQRLNELIALHVVPGRIKIEGNQGKMKNFSSYHHGCLSIEHLQGNSIRVGPEAMVTDSAEFANGHVYYIDRLLWEPYEDAKSCYEQPKQSKRD